MELKQLPKIAPVKAAALELTAEEMEAMEQLAGETPLNVIRYWEKEMK